MGVRGYVPFGEGMVFATHVLPEYVWWQKTENLRRWQGRAGAGIFGNVNRLGIQASLTREESNRFFSREFEDRVPTQDDQGAVTLEVDIGHGFSVFGTGSLRRLAFDETNLVVTVPVSTLDRDEELVRGGVRYHSQRGTLLTLGFEASDVEFEEEGSDRSNTGESVLFSLTQDPARFGFSVDLAWRSLEPKTGPETVAFEDLTGSLNVSYRITPPFEVRLYGQSKLVYSFQEGWAYYFEEVTGLSAEFSLNASVKARVFGELGEAEFQAFDPLVTPLRLDDFESLGAGLEVDFGRVTLLMSASETTYTSTLPQFDRTVNQFLASFSFGSDSGPWG
jgi:hypothetical protein